MISDDTKLNCAGEFMSICETPHQMSQAVGALSALLDGNTSVEFLEGFAEALNYCVEQVKESVSNPDSDLADDLAWDSLSFSHAYLAKAYEKKVGRA